MYFSAPKIAAWVITERHPSDLNMTQEQVLSDDEEEEGLPTGRNLNIYIDVDIERLSHKQGHHFSFS